MIYVPPVDGDAWPPKAGQWLTLSDEHIAWDGPDCMRIRHALKPYYGELETFFCERLHMPRWPEDVFVEELREIVNHSTGPIDAQAHVHVHQILLDLDYVLSRPHAGTPPWLKEFLSLPFIPVRTNSQVVELRNPLDGAVYLPDADGEFEGLFKDLVPIVAFPVDARSLLHKSVKFFVRWNRI